MKKALIYLAAMAMFTACSTDIDYTDPDNKSDMIQFSVASIDEIASPAENKAKATSRAGEHTHSAWDDAKHANTLGVFGFYNEDPVNVIFNNQKVTYAESKWSYTPAKYWPEYLDKTSFDFFGYMVENADPLADPLPTASVSKSDNIYTLSFNAAISSPILTSPANTPLICHVPERVNQTQVGMPINFEMDQTLAGFNIQFQLGEKMNALRYFVIKSVKIYGNSIPVSGKVSRAYTLSGGTWTQGQLSWSELTTQNIAANAAVAIASDWVVTNNEDDGYAANLAARTVNTHDSWVQWGGAELTDGAFYVIPSASFNPTIEVIYDEYSDADRNGGTLTRKDVKSTIILNNTNFAQYTIASTGEIHPIKIKIVPDYLYALADDDQATGFLIVTE